MYFQSTEEMSRKADWYRTLFEKRESGTVLGDGSTYYSMAGIYPGTARRICGSNPSAKIIYIVRHPLRRIESAWMQLLSVGDGNSFRGFDWTLMKTPLLLDPSLYWMQLSEYRRFFPDNQILIQFFEDFVADEATVVAQCLEFLSLMPLTSIERYDESARNSSVGKRQRWPLVDAVRTVPGYERFKRFIPQQAKTLFAERLTKAGPLHVSWSEAALSWTIARIASDSAQFSEHAGWSEDRWQLH